MIILYIHIYIYIYIYIHTHINSSMDSGSGQEFTENVGRGSEDGIIWGQRDFGGIGLRRKHGNWVLLALVWEPEPFRALPLCGLHAAIGAQPHHDILEQIYRASCNTKQTRRNKWDTAKQIHPQVGRDKPNLQKRRSGSAAESKAGRNAQNPHSCRRSRARQSSGG